MKFFELWCRLFWLKTLSAIVVGGIWYVIIPQNFEIGRFPNRLQCLNQTFRFCFTWLLHIGCFKIDSRYWDLKYTRDTRMVKLYQSCRFSYTKGCYFESKVKFNIRRFDSGRPSSTLFFLRGAILNFCIALYISNSRFPRWFLISNTSRKCICPLFYN